MAKAQKKRAAETGVTIHEWEVHIHVGTISCRTDFRDEDVFVVRLGDELRFARADWRGPLETFVLDLAGDLDGEHDHGDYDVRVRPRILRGALDRLDGRGEIQIGDGTLVPDGRSRVFFRAPCGEARSFRRADLEIVLEEFG